MKRIASIPRFWITLLIVAVFALSWQLTQAPTFVRADKLETNTLRELSGITGKTQDASNTALDLIYGKGYCMAFADAEQSAVILYRRVLFFDLYVYHAVYPVSPSVPGQHEMMIREDSLFFRTTVTAENGTLRIARSARLGVMLLAAPIAALVADLRKKRT